jgi:hypothetical protein
MWIELNIRVHKLGLKRIVEDPEPDQAPTLGQQP